MLSLLYLGVVCVVSAYGNVWARSLLGWRGLQPRILT